MNELTVHPDVYATGRSTGLLAMLETLWLREQPAGDGTMYIVSGFANYNGGVRFYPVFRNHVHNGGKVVAVFAGSARQKLTSRQVVAELLDCGVEVHIVNRKRLMHMKSYGAATSTGELLVVTSGNFTGPGMAQNVEMAVLLDRPSTKELGFSWSELVARMFDQGWSVSQPKLEDRSPAWQLLYDEEASTVVLDETNEVTMVLRLGHADTVRIKRVARHRRGQRNAVLLAQQGLLRLLSTVDHPEQKGAQAYLLQQRRRPFQRRAANIDGAGDVRGGEQSGFPAWYRPVARHGVGRAWGLGRALPNGRKPVRTAPLSTRHAGDRRAGRTRAACDRPSRQALWLPRQ